MKSYLKKKSIFLRKKGWSYSEILRRVPVAKSTLSLWLRSVGLSKKQRQRFTEKKLLAAIRGGETRKKNRLEQTREIINNSILEINSISNEKLKLLGAVLYWAEGSKSKEYNPSTGVVFGNSDPLMCKLFIRWLVEILAIPKKEICFSIYVHETHKNRVKEIKEYWAKTTGFSNDEFDKIYFKKDKPSTQRRNRREAYHGLLRITVRKSTNLSRKIQGWIEGICIQCGVV